MDKMFTLLLHTLVPRLKSLHQGGPVNARQEHNTQEHSFKDSPKTREQSKKNVVEEKEIRHDREQPAAEKRK